MQPHTSIMDRGRPISSPEFQHAFPRTRHVSSPQTSPQVTTHSLQSTTSPTVLPEQRLSTPAQSPVAVGILRKPAPKLSYEQLRREERLDARLRDQRQLGVASQRQVEMTGSNQALTTADRAILNAVQSHRRTISADIDHSPQRLQRPSVRRLATLPDQLDEVVQARRDQVIQRLQGNGVEERLPVHGGKGKGREEVRQGRLNESRSSVTFNENPVQQTPHERPGFGRSSSFSRFFHSKSKQTNSPSAGTKPLKSSLRPMSMDASASNTSLSSVELGGMIKRLAGSGSPKQLY